LLSFFSFLFGCRLGGFLCRWLLSMKM
jgi:hypothetical protein